MSTVLLYYSMCRCSVSFLILSIRLFLKLKIHQYSTSGYQIYTVFSLEADDTHTARTHICGSPSIILPSDQEGNIQVQSSVRAYWQIELTHASMPSAPLFSRQS